MEKREPSYTVGGNINWYSHYGNTVLLLLSRFSHVRLLATPWTAGYQAPPSLRFSRREYWSRLPLPSPKHYEVSLKKKKKTKDRVTIWSSSPTPGKNLIQRKLWFKKIHTLLCSQQHYLQYQDMEAIWMSINRWMDKKDVIHIHNRILFSHKNELNNAICSNMDEPRDYHSKRSHII